MKLVVALLVAVLSTPLAGSWAQERPTIVSTVATLTVLVDPVERVGAGASRSDLAVGDRVVTGRDGRALITFLDGSTVAVEPASEVTVRQAQMDRREASRLGLLITVGTVWARVAGWLGGRATLTLESNAYSATAHDGLIGAQQQPDGPFVCWSRAGALEVAPTGGPPQAMLRPGQKATLAAGRPVVIESFAVNRSTLEVSTAGPVLPLVVMPDGRRLAGFVEPGVEVSQVFGSLTVARPGDSRAVEVPAGLPGPFVLLLAAVGDGPFTITVVGRHQGTESYRQAQTGTAQRGEHLRADPRTARAGGAGMSALRPDMGWPGAVVLSPLELAAPRP